MRERHTASSYTASSMLCLLGYHPFRQHCCKARPERLRLKTSRGVDAGLCCNYAMLVLHLASTQSIFDLVTRGTIALLYLHHEELRQGEWSTAMFLLVSVIEPRFYSPAARSRETQPYCGCRLQGGNAMLYPIDCGGNYVTLTMLRRQHCLLQGKANAHAGDPHRVYWTGRTAVPPAISSGSK